MHHNTKYKEDWDDTLDRWTRFWHGRPLDRPIIRIAAPNGKSVRWPTPSTNRDRFLGVEYNLARIEATLESTWFGGEAIPFVFFNAGWIASAYMSTPQFHDRTIWFEPTPVDYERNEPFPLDWQNPWLKQYEAFHAAMLRRAGKDDFMIGQACILPANDMLSMLMGTETFLTALIEHKDWMHAAFGQLARNWCALMRHFFEMNRRVNDFWYGTSWNSFWGPEPFIAYQSDVSCMISPEMFQTFILPELALAAKEFGPVWYHLDGSGALPHLECLLACDTVRAIQWVPGEGAAPHGEAWLEVYRKIQRTGKVLDLYVPNLRDAEYVIRNLDPNLLSLRVVCGSVEEGREFLNAARRWSGAHAQRRKDSHDDSRSTGTV
jgi:5-methyltetrahydrofolate--homocysteine methyltransferase